MPTFSVTFAVDVPAYCDLDIEADSLTDLKRKLDLWDTGMLPFDPEWGCEDSARVTSIYDYSRDAQVHIDDRDVYLLSPHDYVSIGQAVVLLVKDAGMEEENFPLRVQEIVRQFSSKKTGV